MRQLDLMDLNITGDVVDGIIANAPKIRNLILAECTALTDKAVESICNLGRHLHCLYLSYAAAITDNSVILLAQSYSLSRIRDFVTSILPVSPPRGFCHLCRPHAREPD
jgi:F-box and leucine-rich repeat protein GRR1